MTPRERPRARRAARCALNTNLGSPWTMTGASGAPLSGCGMTASPRTRAHSRFAFAAASGVCAIRACPRRVCARSDGPRRGVAAFRCDRTSRAPPLSMASSRAVALITGGARGLGEAFARVLLSRRLAAHVVLADIGDAGPTAERFNREFGRDAALALSCDVTDARALEGAMDLCVCVIVWSCGMCTGGWRPTCAETRSFSFDPPLSHSHL